MFKIKPEFKPLPFSALYLEFYLQLSVKKIFSRETTKAKLASTLGC